MANSIVSANQAKAPWIGIGPSGNWTSVDEAMEACGLNFTVTSEDVKFSYDEPVDGSTLTYYNSVPGYQVTVRSDSHEPLGVVSNTYKIVQNKEIFSILEPFINAGGVVTNGGMTPEGLCFMVVRMAVENVAGDDYEINVMATNSHNGRFPASILWTPVRIICQNMYRSLMNNTDSVVRLRHSLNITGRLGAMKTAYEAFNQLDDLFDRDVVSLKERKAKHSIDEVVEYMFPYSNLNVDSARYQSSKDRVDERRAYYINHYYNSPTNSDHGTCFALVNAYYDYMSHDVPVRSTEDEYKGKRLSNIVGGKMVDPRLMNMMCS